MTVIENMQHLNGLMFVSAALVSTMPNDERFLTTKGLE